MFRILLFVSLTFCLVNCTEADKVEGLDVTQKFLKSMGGTFVSKANVPQSEDWAPDVLTIKVSNNKKTSQREGTYSIGQFWYLEYSLETCQVASNQNRCSIEDKSTYCRVVDSGKILQVIELSSGVKNSEGAPIMHKIKGLPNTAFYDEDSSFSNADPDSEGPDPAPGSEDPKPNAPTSQDLACRAMVRKKNQSISANMASFGVIWPDDNTLKFTHETVPAKPGIQRLDDAGTFQRE